MSDSESTVPTRRPASTTVHFVMIQEVPDYCLQRRTVTDMPRKTEHAFPRRITNPRNCVQLRPRLQTPATFDWVSTQHYIYFVASKAIEQRCVLGFLIILSAFRSSSVSAHHEATNILSDTNCV